MLDSDGLALVLLFLVQKEQALRDEFVLHVRVLSFKC